MKKSGCSVQISFFVGDVPESGTQEEYGNDRGSEASCRAIRYAKQHRIASGIERMAYQFLIKNMKHVLEMVDFMGERVLLHSSFGMCFLSIKKKK